MKNLLLIPLIVLGLCTLSRAQTAATQASKPNVIIIVADDLGFADVGFQKRSKDVRTPNLDAIAANGVHFTRGYVSCPVCSPTRAGLLTGRYQERFGFEQNPLGRQEEDRFGLPVDEEPLPQVLKGAGYSTAAIGKWHLGDQPQFHPNKRGFDEFFGFLGGAHGYLHLENPEARNAIQHNGTPVGEKEYLTDALTRESVAFVEQHKSDPFFLYLAYNAPHTPMQATEKYLSRFADVKDKDRRTFLAMLSALDDGVGEVLATLKENNLTENTIIFFMSDNGGPTHANTSSNAPYLGEKGSTYEGGVHVPMAIQWPGHIPAGKTDDRLVIQLDFFPTICAIAGAELPKKELDGKDLMPFLTEKTDAPIHDSYFWRFGPRKGMRTEQYKLQWNGDEKPNLFDLKEDPTEAKNLAGEHPEIVDDLMKQYRDWTKQLMKPRWPGRTEGDGKATEPTIH